MYERFFSVLVLICCVSCAHFQKFNFFGNAPVKIYDKKFYDHEEAAAYQITVIQQNLAVVKKLTYHGGSLLVKMPTEYEYLRPPWLATTGLLGIRKSQELFFLNYYKREDWCVNESLRKSEMFDSVVVTTGSDYLSYAREHGFTYIYQKRSDGVIFYDLLTNEQQVIAKHSGTANLNELFDLFIRNKIAKRGVASYITVPSPQLKTEFNYNDQTKKGFISSKITGMNERTVLMKEIANICATKNIKLSTGIEAPSGHFRILDEQLKDGTLTISFESLY